MRLLWTAIEWKVETLAASTVDIEQAREALTEFKETTWGLELREIDWARFVVLPAGTSDRPCWTAAGAGPWSEPLGCRPLEAATGCPACQFDCEVRKRTGYNPKSLRTPE